jgi:hypothetical protein
MTYLVYAFISYFSCEKHITNIGKKLGKAIHLTGREALKGCETSRISHFIDNRITDGVKVASLTRRPTALYPQEDS